jgi:hypothetical protein
MRSRSPSVSRPFGSPRRVIGQAGGPPHGDTPIGAVLAIAASNQDRPRHYEANPTNCHRTPSVFVLRAIPARRQDLRKTVTSDVKDTCARGAKSFPTSQRVNTDANASWPLDCGAAKTIMQPTSDASRCDWRSPGKPEIEMGMD